MIVKLVTKLKMFLQEKIKDIIIIILQNTASPVSLQRDSGAVKHKMKQWSSEAGLRPNVCEETYVVEGYLLVVPWSCSAPREPLPQTAYRLRPTPHSRFQPGAGCCLLLQYPIQTCARGGRRIVALRTCNMRYDDPRLVWTSLTTTH